MDGAPLSFPRDGGVTGTRARCGEGTGIDVVRVRLWAAVGAASDGICGDGGGDGDGCFGGGDGIDAGEWRCGAGFGVQDGCGWGFGFRLRGRLRVRCGGGGIIVGISGRMRYCCFGGGDGGSCSCCAASSRAAWGDVASPAASRAREGGVLGEGAFIEGRGDVDGGSESFEPGDVDSCVVAGEEELVGLDAEADDIAALQVVGCDAGLGVLERVGAWWCQRLRALQGEARARG